MGRFRSSLFLLLLGACGDNLDVDGLGEVPTDEIQPGGNASEKPRYVPSVCGVNSWSPPAFGADFQLSVVPRPDVGATLMAVRKTGGPIFGQNFSAHMDLFPEGRDVPIAGKFDQVSASYVQGHPVVTGLYDGGVYVNMLDENLDNPHYVTKIEGSHIAEPAFYTAGGNLVMPVVNDSGLWMHKFDDSLEPLESKHFKATKPATSIAVTQLGNALVTAWSTDTECYLMVNSTYEPGVSARVETACPSPRVAINQTSGEGVMLFDSVDGVRLMPIHTTQLGGDAPVIRTDASSPRALFDGTNFWVSYLDARGDLIVGFLDANYNPVTMSLGSRQMEHQAFELVHFDGAPWVISVDEEGYTAHRMCVETIW